VHIPILPHRHWPSTRGKKLLASPTSPLESASRGDPFRRFVRSLSLRPSWLLAPCADPTKMVPSPPQPPGAFTSGLPVPKELPGMTTAPHGNLCRRDFHPQVQQLASLRSLPGVRSGDCSPASTVLSRHCDFLPSLLPRFVSFVWQYHGTTHLFAPAVAACCNVRPGVGHSVSPSGHSSMETTGSPKFLGNPHSRLHMFSDPGRSKRSRPLAERSRGPRCLNDEGTDDYAPFEAR
jgi:hypothetical protein